MFKSEINIRVLYAHTDKMGVVYYSRYLEYFEAGRNDIMEKLGYPYTKLESSNIALPVIEVHCRYISSAKFDDDIKVVTILNYMPSVRFRIDYNLFVTDKLIIEGYTIHSFVNMIKFRPVKPPEDFVELIKHKI